MSFCRHLSENVESETLAGRVHIVQQRVAGPSGDDKAHAGCQRHVARAVDAVGEFALEAEDDLCVQMGVRACRHGFHAFENSDAVEPTQSDVVRVKTSAEMFVG